MSGAMDHPVRAVLKAADRRRAEAVPPARLPTAVLEEVLRVAAHRVLAAAFPVRGVTVRQHQAQAVDRPPGRIPAAAHLDPAEAVRRDPVHPAVPPVPGSPVRAVRPSAAVTRLPAVHNPAATSRQAAAALGVPAKRKSSAMDRMLLPQTTRS